MLANLFAADVLLSQEGLQVDPILLAALGGTILPLLVATFAQITASSKVKTIINTVLAVLVGVVAYLTTVDGKVTWPQLLICIVTAFGASGTSYNHLWKQLNVTAWLAVATKYFGAGANPQITRQLKDLNLSDGKIVKLVNDTAPLNQTVQVLSAFRPADPSTPPVDDTELLRQRLAEGHVVTIPDEGSHVLRDNDLGGGPGRSPGGQHITGS